jgi:ADP-L-glycero-D-manno-heptose 6-epimerase
MYLITGGAGFIGSNLVAALAQRDETIAVCDWLGQDERWRNLARHEIADLVAPEELPRWLANKAGRIRAVLHLGAVSSTTESNVDLIVQRNIRSSLDLLQWCSSAAVPFIYASSAATYGDGSAGFDDDGSVEALARLRPLNAYGWSKHVVDRRIARLHARGEALPPQWVGLKFFNVYGPNEYHKGGMQSLVARCYPAVRSGGPMRLFRSYDARYVDGGQLRDFVYVDDCIAVILWLLENPSVCGLFNVGTGIARSWLDLATAMFAACGRERAVEFIDMPPTMVDKYQYFTQARVERLRSAGYTRSFVSLEAGVSEYIQKYLATEDRHR